MGETAESAEKHLASFGSNTVGATEEPDWVQYWFSAGSVSLRWSRQKSQAEVATFLT